MPPPLMFAAGHSSLDLNFDWLFNCLLKDDIQMRDDLIILIFAINRLILLKNASLVKKNLKIFLKNETRIGILFFIDFDDLN